ELDYELMLQAGYRIPDDLGFSMLGWKSYRPYSPMKISGFNTKPELLAESAVSFLASQIHEHAYGLPGLPKTLMIQGEYHEGQTLRSMSK
ncbi:MAG: LacI family DNA-binding transcriptional regulator, partial [Puniceicoccales bacterium]